MSVAILSDGGREAGEVLSSSSGRDTLFNFGVEGSADHLEKMPILSLQRMSRSWVVVRMKERWRNEFRRPDGDKATSRGLDGCYVRGEVVSEITDICD